MRFNVLINQDKCLKHKLNVSQAALMQLFNELPSWASEKFMNGQTYWFISRNKVIEELPLFYEKPDTVYRHFKILHDLKMIDYYQDKRRDFVRLTALGKQWNNSEMNPRKLGNESELAKNIIVDYQEVKPSNSDSFPTDNIYNNTNDKREATAIEFLSMNFPSRYTDFLSKYKTKIPDFEKFETDFNCKVIEEEKKFEQRILFARLERLANNWISMGLKNQKENRQPELPAPKRNLFVG